ncbi:MAG: trigger factor [Bacillota bacterium]
MKTSITKKENSKITLEVEVAATDFQEAVNKAYKKVANQVRIPGFRKGKVPRAILQNYVGKDALYAEAVDSLIPEAYIKAVNENQIEPIDQPQIDIVQYEEGKPLIFTAEIPVKPDVVLGQYKDIEIEFKGNTVGEAEVDNYLGIMQQRHAQLESVADKPLENEDIAIIDFEGFLNGELFEGGKGENYNLTIGSGTFIPGFEEQLLGMKPGEEREIHVTFPEDYNNDSLKGKDVVFKVKLNEIKIKKLMPIDDEFAKDVSEFETLEELKVDVKNKLNKMAEQENEQQTRIKVLDKVAESSQVEIPRVLIDRKIDSNLKDMEYSLLQQGLDMEKYLKITNTTMEQIREQYEESAQKSVKIDLVLEAIAKSENIQVSEEELNEEIEQIAKQYKQTLEQLKELLIKQQRLDSLKEGIRIDKTIKFLVDNAVILEPKEEKEDQENKEEKADIIDKSKIQDKKLEKDDFEAQS